MCEKYKELNKENCSEINNIIKWRTSIYRPLYLYCKLKTRNEDLLTEEYLMQGMKFTILKKIYVKAVHVEDVNLNEECKLLLKNLM